MKNSERFELAKYELELLERYSDPEIYRKFYVHGLEIIQRLSDNYINFHHINYQLNTLHNTDGRGRTYQYLFTYQRTKDYINVLKYRNIIDDEMPAYKKDNYGVIWVHPFLFLDFFVFLGVEYRASLFMYMIKDKAQTVT